MVELDERAEEILEKLWMDTEEKKANFAVMKCLEIADSKPLEQLLQAGYVTVSGDEVRLTGIGKPEAVNVVRRHRLAERLLTDVLGTVDALMHEKACKFEHLLDRGLDESICILLGHPKVCPHGKPIPPGKCCLQKQTKPHSVVAPLSQLSPGEQGKVAYVYAPETGKLQKLMALGILPGALVSLIQVAPSFVFQAGQTQFAVDKEIADAIYVRLIEGSNQNELTDEGRARGRRRFGFGRHSRNKV